MKQFLMNRRNRKGFTLIELMIVVAIIGILAAVAVPMFLNYLRDSKTSEAKLNLKSMGEGAITFYNAEHSLAGVDPAVGGGATSKFSQQYPNTTNTALLTNFTAWLECTTTGNVAGEAQMPDAVDFNASPWINMKFGVSKPHYYKYCIVSADNVRVEMRADATLDSGAGASDSSFQVVVAVQDNKPVMGTTDDITGQ